MLSEGRLEKHIVKTCRVFSWVNGVRAVSLIEAVWHFADYLVTHSRIDNQEANMIRTMCRRLFNMALRAVDSTGPVSLSGGHRWQDSHAFENPKAPPLLGWFHTDFFPM
jgi:hypothetical protein